MSALGARTELRKVIIVNTTDVGGGAERMSMTALDRFNAMGIDTWLLVGEKRSDHPRVMPFFLSPYFDYRPFDNARRLAAIERRRRVERWLGMEDFNFPYAHEIDRLTGTPPDLVICHNLHGGYFDLRAIAPLSRRLPVVLRLFDSWLFTGHCASTLGCMRWQNGCGRCPDLAIPPAIRRDASAFNWRRKQRRLRDGAFYVSAESSWMIDRARRSLLAPVVRDWRTIPSGVDLDVFSPGPAKDARRRLGVPEVASVLAYVANHGPENAYKDFETIRAALALVAASNPDRELVLVAAGSNAPAEKIAQNATIRWIGFISDPVGIADVYRAADLLVGSSVEESYGLSVAEALACGTPVVLGSAGGVVEVVEDGVTGIVVPPRDPARLAEAIDRLLAHPELRRSMSEAALRSATFRFDASKSTAALRDWCEEIIADWRPAPK